MDKITYTVERKRVSECIKLGRIACGLNQQQMADVIGVAKSTIARCESLVSTLEANTFVKVLDACKHRGVIINPVSDDGSINIRITQAALEFTDEDLDKESPE